jgi:hypothetical protein
MYPELNYADLIYIFETRKYTHTYKSYKIINFDYYEILQKKIKTNYEKWMTILYRDFSVDEWKPVFSRTSMKPAPANSSRCLTKWTT